MSFMTSLICEPVHLSIFPYVLEGLIDKLLVRLKLLILKFKICLMLHQLRNFQPLFIEFGIVLSLMIILFQYLIVINI